MSKELTKEILLDLTAQGKTNKQIMQEFGLNNVTFYKLKNDWGLVNKKFSNSKSKDVEIKRPEKQAPEVGQAVVVPKQFEIEKPCNCKQQLNEQILSLKSELAQQKNRNEELTQYISALKKYKVLYFKTAELLKAHLPE